MRNSLYIITTIILVVNTEVMKDDVDKVIEDEITQKLGDDLMQSIERKFQVDLEKSVDMVLIKIKLLLQNGTQHIQEKLLMLQGMMEMIRNHGEEEMDNCLAQKQNATLSLAEKTLHQMVVCGYALIGQDPSQAVRSVANLMTMIKEGVQPIKKQKQEVYSLLRACGHDHDSLKKVIKCVMSKSPLIKSTMMEISGNLVQGVMELTKQLAHGAMHEACLIEVVRTIEDEAIVLVEDIKHCALKNITYVMMDNYIAENNATVLDIERKSDNSSVTEVKDWLRRMIETNKVDNVNLKDKLKDLHKDLDIDGNFVNDNKGF